MDQNLPFKQRIKRTERQCRLCDNSDYNTLDAHRILAGSDGGKYTENNTVVLCANCHRQTHAGDIIIDRYYHSTQGKVLHYFKDGNEFWK